MASRSAERLVRPGTSSTAAVNDASWTPLLAFVLAVVLAFCATMVLTGVLELGRGALAAVVLAAVLGLAAHARDQRMLVRRMRALMLDRDRMATALRAERDLAADSSASKTRFFAAASHDLRQPLHALTINATTLQLVAGRQQDPVIRDLSLSITRALARSNGLLDSLLDLSRLDANAVRLKPEPIDLMALLVAVRDQFKPAANERGLTLDVVPAAASNGPLVITTDLGLMFRVMSNLVSNALKFTRVGGVLLSVFPTQADDEASVDFSNQQALTIVVRDTGRGIDAHDLPHVFEEFFQATVADRDADGSLGLGLSIVKRAVDLMGIDIDIDSTPGEGTIVSLRCPATLTLQQADRHAARWLSPEVDSLDLDLVPSGAPVRALLIEDEQEICNSLQSFLPYVGYEIRSACNSSEALSIVASGFIPTVLVIDQLLREETGILVVHRLWRVLGRVPAVMVTGDTDDATTELALVSGMRLVHKPVDGMRMALIIREAQNAGQDVSTPKS